MVCVGFCPLVVGCWLSVVCCSLRVVRRSLLYNVCCLLSVLMCNVDVRVLILAWCLLLFVAKLDGVCCVFCCVLRVLFGVCCLLAVFRCLMLVARCLPCVVRCVFFVVCCLLPVCC